MAAAARTSRSERRAEATWLISLLLALPAAVPYAAHLVRARSEGLLPTGFVVHDMALHMANAREHFDRGGFQLLYGLPYSPFDTTPAIYFQPHTLLLGIAWRLTGWDPGVVFVLFGAVAAWLCARVALALYRQIIGLDSRAQWLGLVGFFWGGGVLALAGALRHGLAGGSARELSSFEPLFSLDPFEGWWFLNFGRNLVYPTEALYHALFFGVVIAVLRERLRLASVLALLLVLTHPFTGVELMAILLPWVLLERALLGNPRIPWWFVAACGAIVALQLGYYGPFLGRSPEHRSLASQLALPWILPAASLLPAYGVVGALAAWNLRRAALARRFLAVPVNRLLLVWFAVAFALANHDLVMRPMQPLHFTRGYIWTPLFLLGAAPLVGLLRSVATGPSRVAGWVGVTALVALLLADNALWLGTFPWRDSAWRQSIYLHEAERELLAFLAADEHRGSVVIPQARKLGYLATVYTPLRAWYSHYLATPHAPARVEELRRFFGEGRLLDAWDRVPLLVVFLRDQLPPTEPGWVRARSARVAFANAAFVVYRVPPAG